MKTLNFTPPIWGKLALLCAMLFAAGAAQAADIVVNETNFPDEAFRTYIQGQFGSTIEESELQATESMVLNNLEIKNLKGIEHFKWLKTLESRWTPIESIDLSQNTSLEELTLQENNLSALDVSNNVNLNFLQCTINHLTTLDVSNNLKLETLYVYENELTIITGMAGLEAIREIRCSNNKLTIIDLRNCPALKTLECKDNNITQLYLHNDTQLKNLECNNNSISIIDMDDCVNLEMIDFTNGLLVPSFDLTKFPLLRTARLSNNELTSLNLKNHENLLLVTCDNNKLTSLDVTNLPKLLLLYCHRNEITDLQITDCPLLECLCCSNNRIKKLDLSDFPNMGKADGQYGKNMKAGYLGQEFDIDAQVVNGKHVIDLDKSMWDAENVPYLFFYSGDNDFGWEITDPEFAGNKLVIDKETEDGLADIHKIQYRYKTGPKYDMTVTLNIQNIPPLNVDITLGKTYGTYCSPYPLDFTNSKLKAYIACGFSANSVMMMRVYQVPAGTGLLLKGTAGTTYTVPVNHCNIQYANLLIGLNEITTVNPTEGQYTNLSLTDGVFRPFTVAGSMGPNRAYLHVLSTVMGTPGTSSAKEYLTLQFDDEDGEATGIESVGQNGKDNGAWYTVQGVKLTGMPTEKGIYIHNGKKVVMK